MTPAKAEAPIKLLLSISAPHSAARHTYRAAAVMGLGMHELSMKEIAMLLILASLSRISGADSATIPNEINAGAVEGLCGLQEFTECLNLSKSECIEIFLEASEACPTLTRESQDLKIPDPVCTTNVFIEQLDLPDKHVQKCDSKLEKIMKSYDK